MRVSYLSKSTSLYDPNLILIYRMSMVIWLFLAKRADYKFVAPCIAWIAQRRRNSSWQYFYISLGFPHPVWRQGAFSTRLQNTWCTSTFYLWKADVFIHRLSNNVYYWWIAINFSDNWKRTAGTRQRYIQQVAGSPRWGRFTIETPLQRERGLEIQREQRRRRARISSGHFNLRIVL